MDSSPFRTIIRVIEHGRSRVQPVSSCFTRQCDQPAIAGRPRSTTKKHGREPPRLAGIHQCLPSIGPRVRRVGKQLSAIWFGLNLRVSQENDHSLRGRNDGRLRETSTVRRQQALCESELLVIAILSRSSDVTDRIALLSIEHDGEKDL